jgi:putative ABC transport system substrate-binding protein
VWTTLGRAGAVVIGRRAMLVAGAGAFLLPPSPFAQPPHRMFRIGMLASGSRTRFTDAIVTALGDLGYVEGRNTVVERRFAEGHLERLPELAAELVRLRVEILMVQGTPATLAARKSTRTIPIVFAANSDPVGVGLVASLARPGGNVTGTSLMASELSGKRLELLHALAPALSRIAILWDSSNPGMSLRVRETEIAARQSQVALRSIGPRTADELEASLAELGKQPPDALLVTVEPFTRRHLARILDFCSTHRIPSMFEESSYVEAGGLMSYGPDLLEIFRRAAVYVDRILKGATPADLPGEQPTKFELVINMKTARTLGLSIPQAVLARADRVIE